MSLCSRVFLQLKWPESLSDRPNRGIHLLEQFEAITVTNPMLFVIGLARPSAILYMPLPTQRMQNGRLLFGLHEMKSSPIEGLTISNITSERQNDIVGDFLSEILRLSETPTCRLSVEAALKKLGVLNPDEQLIFHRDLAAWHRSGAETYSCSAELTIAGASGATLCRTLICKAVFTFGPLSDQSLSRWLERYALLAENGVQVPHVYFADRGVIVQDYIEHSLPDF